MAVWTTGYAVSPRIASLAVRDRKTTKAVLKMKGFCIVCGGAIKIRKVTDFKNGSLPRLVKYCVACNLPERECVCFPEDEEEE